MPPDAAAALRRRLQTECRHARCHGTDVSALTGGGPDVVPHGAAQNAPALVIRSGVAIQMTRYAFLSPLDLFLLAPFHLHLQMATERASTALS